VEEERSSLRTKTAGSDALVFAESVARRFLRAVAPGRGAAGPSRRALRPSGRECVSQLLFGVAEAGSRFRGDGGESLKGTRGEQRPWGRGNPATRERTRRGIKASKRAEFAVRAITVLKAQGNREADFRVGEKGVHSRRGNSADTRQITLGAWRFRETGGDKVCKVAFDTRVRNLKGAKRPGDRCAISARGTLDDRQSRIWLRHEIRPWNARLRKPSRG
jgi:hypothetical protein